MQKMTHLLSGIALGAAFAPNAALAAVAVAGALCPDALDRMVALGSHERWSRIHRTWSHNVAYWALAAMAASLLRPGTRLPWGRAVPDPFHLTQAQMDGIGLVLIFFLAGVFAHLALDWLTPMGVPAHLFDNTSRIRLGKGVVKTGSLADTLLGAALLLAGAARFAPVPERLHGWFADGATMFTG
jgi:membrane-bound metal-dependent hydrolase YbcI (DUF457 family)